MSLPRRTFLRGAGVAISLPMLDAMVPAFRRPAISSEVSLIPPQRMIVIQTNMGILSQHFFPASSGTDFQLTPYLELLKDFKNRMTVFSGVSHPDVDGAHEAETIVSFRRTSSRKRGVQEFDLTRPIGFGATGPVTRFPSFVLDVNAEKYSRDVVLKKRSQSSL